MGWILLPFLFAASAFFSASETAFFALRNVDFVRWKEEGNRVAGILKKMLESPSRLIATIFIGNEIVNVSISAIIAALLIPKYPGYGKTLALAAATLGILVFGDLAPKALVWPRARAFSLAAARPFRLFARIVAPLRFLMEKAADAIVLVLGGGAFLELREGFTEQEFRALVEMGEETGTLDAGERRLINNIFDLTDQRAGEIMTPLSDVFMVPSTLSYPELLARLRLYRRSRIPVYDGDPRKIAGILYFKALLRPMAEGRNDVRWQDLLVPPYVIPVSKKLPHLLREFQKRKVHLALVVDEFGTVVGIVTLEDVLEELFGEIREEHDREEREVVPRPDGTFRVLGRMPVHRFNETFGATLPDEGWDTVAGFLLHEFGRLPSRGDAITLDSFRFVVERVKGIRIAEVIVQRMPGEDAG
jgi:putative hemolysin